jgi:hypothetical protein
MTCEFRIEEKIRFSLASKEPGTQEYDLCRAYIEGMLDGLAAYGNKIPYETKIDSWAAYGAHVARVEGIDAYFRLREVIEAYPEALTNYGQDLYKHDFHTLRERPNTSFFWFLRELGTHIIWADSADLEDHAKSVLSTWGPNRIIYAGYYNAETKTLTRMNLSSYKGIIKDLVSLRC